MSRETDQAVTAVCGDLLLAKDCIAELKSAGFAGDVSLISRRSGDDLARLGFLAYGQESGELACRGAILGSLVGANAGTAFSAISVFGISTLAWCVIGSSMGAVLGGVSGWRASQSLVQDRDRDGRRGRLLLRCHGAADEIALAYRTLQNSPCHHLRLHSESGADLDRTDEAVTVASWVS